MVKLYRSHFWEGFWQIADPKIWVASTVPMAVGAAIAYNHLGSFSWGWFILGVIAIYLLEIGKNAVNEYIDYQSGVDRFVTPERRTPFSGGKKTIIDGKLSLQENLVIAIVTIAVGSLIGIIIVFLREFNILWFGLAGVFFALFYSIPPLQFSYRGFGEAVVGFTFGPLITCGTYLVQTHTLSVEVILASIPLGLLISNVLWINEYPDYEADLQGGKLNSLVRMGKEKGVSIYALLFGLAYLFIIFLSIFSRNPWWLLALLSMPLAFRAIIVARRHFDNIPRLVEANAKTVQIYMITGITMVIASLLNL